MVVGERVPAGSSRTKVTSEQNDPSGETVLLLLPLLVLAVMREETGEGDGGGTKKRAPLLVGLGVGPTTMAFAGRAMTNDCSRICM